MDSVPGDKFIEDCARFIRFNESKLSQAASTSSNAPTAWLNPVAWLRPTSPPPVSRQGNNAATSRPTLRPTPLRLTSHHLYYLLIRFEAIGLSTGPLDVRIPSTSRPSSYFAFISNHAAGAGIQKKDRDDSMSISSLQTTLSSLGLGPSSRGMSSGRGDGNGGGWWGGKKIEISTEIKYIYSAMTKIPAIRLVPPPLKLIQDFEDCPGELSVPLDVFRNVQLLEFEDTDPRAFLGWDRLSMQLRSLSIKRSGVEDITDIIVDAVILDAKRRRGERIRPRNRKVHHPAGDNNDDEGVKEQEVRSTDSASINPSNLPSLAWHFLRHLSLSDNSLTFLHSSCLSCLPSLTSLDLSNNLLNAVPPSLNLLPSLHSLNLSNNLIDSVMGIPQALPNIKALNLSQNRLESLCGVERLPTLIRIDLRKNEIFETGEIGRLALLPKLAEVYIAGNPLLDEVDDARVEIFIEFAKESNNLENLKLDNEVVGYFEKQRVRERLPNFDRLTQRARESTPSAEEGDTTSKKEIRRKMSEAAPPRPSAAAGPSAYQETGPVVKTVRHRAHNHDSSSSAAQRRNRRVVELAQDANAEEGAKQVQEAPQEMQEEVSDSDVIKRAALAGDVDAALGTMSRQGGATVRQGAATVSASREPKTPASVPPEVSTVKKSNVTAAAPSLTAEQSETAQRLKTHMRIRSLEQEPVHNQGFDKNGRTEDDKIGGPAPGEETLAPGPRIRFTRRDPAVRNRATMSMYDNGSSNIDGKSTISPSAGGDSNLRKKIEALKGEVGDDWLRLLARGESVYVPHDEEGEEQEI